MTSVICKLEYIIIAVLTLTEVFSKFLAKWNKFVCVGEDCVL